MFCRLLICIGALATLGSCSADKAASSSQITLDLGTVVAETSPVTAALSEPDPTTASVAASLPTIAPTSTELTTTTTIDPKAEVEAAYLATVEVRSTCNFDPVNCAFEKIAVQGSPSDLFNRDIMNTRIGGNLRAVEGFGSERTRVDDVVLGGDTAFVTTCNYDDVVIFDVADPTNPADDVVFNDIKASRIAKWEMRLVNGIWLRYEGTAIEKLTDGDLCGF